MYETTVVHGMIFWIMAKNVKNCTNLLPLFSLLAHICPSGRLACLCGRMPTAIAEKNSFPADGFVRRTWNTLNCHLRKQLMRVGLELQMWCAPKYYVMIMFGRNLSIVQAFEEKYKCFITSCCQELCRVFLSQSSVGLEAPLVPLDPLESAELCLKPLLFQTDPFLPKN